MKTGGLKDIDTARWKFHYMGGTPTIVGPKQRCDLVMFHCLCSYIVKPLSVFIGPNINKSYAYELLEESKRLAWPPHVLLVCFNVQSHTNMFVYVSAFKIELRFSYETYFFGEMLVHRVDVDVYMTPACACLHLVPTTKS